MKCTDIEAAQLAERQRENFLAKNQNFSFETVLSTERNLKLLERAKEQGYFIKCYYILTADPIINVARIELRTLTGGHDVPKDKITSRYDKALSLIPRVIMACDIMHIYDNSSTSPYRIFKKRKEEFYYDDKSQFWNKNDIIALTDIYSAKYLDLNK